MKFPEGNSGRLETSQDEEVLVSPAIATPFEEIKVLTDQKGKKMIIFFDHPARF
ncbi:hypothetical protein LG307_14400 [Sutcliffiella horikoshii]|uniref:hypothetical protein n=1 Tax=Sutcliffiella horikoshii TaxID=79883 RepID=UPI0038500972